MTSYLQWSELESRPGAFWVPQYMLERKFFEIRKLISQVFIIKCEYDYFRHSFNYTGYSELFTPVLEGTEPLEYKIVINNGVAQFELLPN